ncbi:MAG: HAD-IA family hydrolase [Propionibacteriaceae bacterium]|nr:HAD-IA family hydrolase [Propionibacteriaceae bacterium]
MVTTRWPCVIFDLDGTVADTIDLIMSSYAHALKSVLGVEVDPPVMRSWIGRTLQVTFEAEWPDRTGELIAAYRAWNDVNAPAMVTAYPGMPELIGELAAAGVSTGVATSKGRPVAVDSLRIAGIDLAVTVAAEDTATHKPNPAPLVLARERLGMTTEPTVYVGDALVDIQAARAAGVDVIAVTWGAGEPDSLLDAGPTALASTVEELRTLLLG